jgi:hypothetical protein
MYRFNFCCKDYTINKHLPPQAASPSLQAACPPLRESGKLPSEAIHCRGILRRIASLRDTKIKFGSSGNMMEKW